jgi:hypothetical protein
MLTPVHSAFQYSFGSPSPFGWFGTRFGNCFEGRLFFTAECAESAERIEGTERARRKWCMVIFSLFM